VKESAAIKALVERVEARQQIWIAYSTLYDALDSNDVNWFVDCFTSGGSIYTGGRGTFTGRDAWPLHVTVGG